MARNRGVNWGGILGAIAMYATMKYYAIPKFQQDIEHTSQVAMQQNIKNYQNAIAQQKADEQARKINYVPIYYLKLN